jgi:transmembrane sensor
MTESDRPNPMNVSTISPSDEILDSFAPVEREAYEWVARFMSGEMKPADIEAMKLWYGQSPSHAAAYAQVRHVWMGLGPAASTAMQRGGKAALSSRRAGWVRPDAPSVLGRRAVLGSALAASAVAGAYVVVRPPLDIWPSYAALTADYRTEIGERRQVMLGSAVSLDLNTRTSVSIRSQMADATRIALIAGEAAISTTSATSPLNVAAGAGNVVAGQADFNLRCDGAEVLVTCLRGDLRVEYGGAAIPLAARQQVSYGANGIGVVASVDPDIVMAWRRGVLIFDGTAVAQVVSEVNRYRPGRIVLMNREIGRRLLNARLRIVEADKIVVQIVHIFGAKATNLPGGIVILT